MYLKYVLYAFLLYLLYRLIFGFIVPVYKTTRQLKKQFREMHGRMEDAMRREQGAAEMDENLNKPAGSSNKKTTPGDYIDFEEVK
jgi:hypothetical protein